MGHNCECGYQCHCNGDIDDINFGVWTGCTCDNCQNDFDDEDDYADDFEMQ